MVPALSLFLARVAFALSCCASRFFGPVTWSPAANSSCFAHLSEKTGCGLYSTAGSVSCIKFALCRACMFNTKWELFEWQMVFCVCIVRLRPWTTMSLVVPQDPEKQSCCALKMKRRCYNMNGRISFSKERAIGKNKPLLRQFLYDLITLK